MRSPDPVIFSRRVVTDSGIGPATVATLGGRITEVIPGISAESRATLHLADLVLMPGLVDTHVHEAEIGRAHV